MADSVSPEDPKKLVIGITATCDSDHTDEEE
jgi:hypothetical protein